MFLNCDRTAVSRAANSDLHSLRKGRSLELALHNDSHQLAHLPISLEGTRCTTIIVTVSSFTFLAAADAVRKTGRRPGCLAYGRPD